MIRPPDQPEPVALLLPMVSREAHRREVREPRPRTGAELAPGILYVDLEQLDRQRWRDLLPALATARAVVFDLRGYLTEVAFDVITHLSGRALQSPRMDVPLVVLDGPIGHERSGWSVYPSQPPIPGRAVFLADGRTASAGETILQMVRENRLATIVGEPTGGTNGNANSFWVPGGFKVRFTGMRVLLADGASIHGRGIVPDLVVHPTLAGVREGRDEILEAAIAHLGGGAGSSLRGPVQDR